MLQPRAAITTGCESGRQISGRICAQRHEIDRLAPFRCFVGAACGNHLADDAGQQIGGVLPSDQVEKLEALVDEIKRVSAIGKDAVGLGRDEEVRQHWGRRTGGDGGQQRALGCLAVADRNPAPKPAFKRGTTGRLDREERCLAGAAPSQSMATRRTP